MERKHTAEEIPLRHVIRTLTREDGFTFMLVAEVTEVSGAGYCNHLSNAG